MAFCAMEYRRLRRIRNGRIVKDGLGRHLNSAAGTGDILNIIIIPIKRSVKYIWRVYRYNYIHYITLHYITYIYIYILYTVYLIFRHIQMSKPRGIEHVRKCGRDLQSKIALNQQLERTSMHGKFRDFCLPLVNYYKLLW